MRVLSFPVVPSVIAWFWNYTSLDLCRVAEIESTFWSVEDLVKRCGEKEYVDKLRLVIEHLHKCAAYWLRSDHVTQTFKDKTLFDGDVEVFGLLGHSKAIRCYGWSSGEPEKFIIILELPPVDSAQAAVADVSYQVENPRKEK